MTALTKYRLLEGTGLWSGAAEDQRREVVVSFGDATLVILDTRSQIVLSHWSLAAVDRLNPGKRPALFSPDGAREEVLETDDDLLIDALRELRAALEPRQTLFQRYRRAILGAASAASVVLGVLVVPPALVEHTLSVVPMAKRAELGERLVAQIKQSGAVECASPFGLSALQALQARLFQGPARLLVMRGLPLDPPRIQHLPGRAFVIDARLIDQAESAEALAGALAVAGTRAVADDPLRPLLRHAGFIATLRLLTSGDLPQGAERGYTARLLQGAVLTPGMDAVLERFARAELSVRAFTDNPAALDPSRNVLSDGLRAGDPGGPGPVLSDGQWVSLLNICDM